MVHVIISIHCIQYSNIVFEILYLILENKSNCKTLLKVFEYLYSSTIYNSEYSEYNGKYFIFNRSLNNFQIIPYYLWFSNYTLFRFISFYKINTNTSLTKHLLYI